MVNTKYTGSTGRSLPYNIILTRDPTVIGKLFYDKLGRAKTFSDAFDNIPNDRKTDTFIISPKNNNEFISMDYTFDAEGQTYVTIKLVETQQLLEYFFITANGWEEAVSSRVRARSSILGDTNSFDSLLAARPAFYLSFGAGDVFTSWAGPYVIQLADCNLSIDPNGVRILELLFTPSQDTLKVFTDRLVSDTVNVKDSVFSTFKAQGPSSAKGRVIPAKKVFKTTQEVPDFIGNVFGTGRGMIRLDLKRSDVLDSEKNSGSYYTARQRIGESNPVEVPKVGEERERQSNSWNIAVRQLIIEYLDRLFPSLPRGNKLVIFDDDLDAVYPVKKKDGKVVSNGRLVIEMPLSERTRKDIVKRCGTGLRNFGIDITYVPSTEEVNPESKKSLNEIAGKGAKIEAGAGGSVRSSNEGTNYQKQAESRAISKDRVVLSMSMTLDKDADLKGSPPAVVPLMKFQRRLKEISNKPNDFILIEEHNTDILRSLWDAGIIQDWRESVVIFGRKSNVDKLVYARSKPSDTLIANVFPTTDFDAVPIQKFKTFTRKKNNWSLHYGEAKEIPKRFTNAGKRLGSSFGEKFDIPGISKQINRDINPDIPFFAVNVKNANVMSLSFDSKPYVNVLMATAFKPSFRVLDKYFKNNEEQLLKNEDLRFQFVDYIADKINEEKESKRSVDRRSSVKLLMDVMKKDSMAKLVLANDKKTQQLDEFSFLDLLIFKLNGSRLDLNTVEEVGEDNTQGQRQADLEQRINRSIVNVRMRTLPFFNTNLYVGQPCFLYGLANNTIGSRVWEERPAIFTNEYTIIGYKHHIDKNSAFSDFTIAQPGVGARGSSIKSRKVYDLFEKEIKAAKGEFEKVEEKAEEARNLVDSAIKAKGSDSLSTFVVKESLGLAGGFLEFIGYDKDELLGEYTQQVTKDLESIDNEPAKRPDAPEPTFEETITELAKKAAASLPPEDQNR